MTMTMTMTMMMMMMMMMMSGDRMRPVLLMKGRNHQRLIPAGSNAYWAGNTCYIYTVSDIFSTKVMISLSISIPIFHPFSTHFGTNCRIRVCMPLGVSETWGTRVPLTSPLLPPAQFNGSPMAIDGRSFVEIWTRWRCPIEHTMILSSSLKYAGKSLDLDISGYIMIYLYISLFGSFWNIHPVHLSCFVFTGCEKQHIWLLPLVNPNTMYLPQARLSGALSQQLQSQLLEIVQQQLQQVVQPQLQQQLQQQLKAAGRARFHGGKVWTSHLWRGIFMDFPCQSCSNPPRWSPFFPRGKKYMVISPTSPVSHVGFSENRLAVKLPWLNSSSSQWDNPNFSWSSPHSGVSTILVHQNCLVNHGKSPTYGYFSSLSQGNNIH